MSTTANNLHRLDWPRPLRWLLKMDAHGGLPEWWQWFIPRCGNWGGVGWSAGRWLKTGNTTDWDIPSLSPLDELYKEHDRRYRPSESRLHGDLQLLEGLSTVHVDGFYLRLYRHVSALAFGAHAGWLSSVRNGKRHNA